MAHVRAKKWGGHGRPCRPYAAALDYTRRKNSEKWGSIHRVCGHEVDIEGKIRLSNGFLASQDEQFQPHICLESQSEWSISHEWCSALVGTPLPPLSTLHPPDIVCVIKALFPSLLWNKWYSILFVCSNKCNSYTIDCSPTWMWCGGSGDETLHVWIQFQLLSARAMRKTLQIVMSPHRVRWTFSHRLTPISVEVEIQWQDSTLK